MTKCPKCGSYNIKVKREDLGFKKTGSGSIRMHHTVCICQRCGKTWATSGPLSRNDGFEGIVTGCIGIIVIIGIIMLVIAMIGAFFKGCGRTVSKTINGTEYNVNENNINFVTNPYEQYVVDILESVDGIMTISPVSLANDRNHLLENGASSVIYFSYDKINQGDIEGKSVIDKGTDCGGCVEVFENEDDAKNRERKLKIFGFSGSCVRLGTTIVRTSDKLSAEDQVNLETQICKLLLQIKEQ